MNWGGGSTPQPPTIPTHDLIHVFSLHSDHISLQTSYNPSVPQILSSILPLVPYIAELRIFTEFRL